MRQDGPLSPLLLILYMKYLSRKLSKVLNYLKFHKYCQGPGINHLAFTDYLLIFYGVYVSTILNKFMEVFGLTMISRRVKYFSVVSIIF